MWFTPGGSSSPAARLRTAHLDHLAVLPGRDAQGGVLDLAGLLAEDGPQEALLRGQLGLPLGGDLAHQDVPGAHLRPDVDDPLVVQVLEGVLADVGDVAGDLLRAQLGVAGLHLVLLDVQAGEDVLLDQALGDQDGVLEVAPLPEHEGPQHVLPQGQLPPGGGQAVRQGLPGGDPLPGPHQGALREAGALVGAHEGAQRVAPGLPRPASSSDDHLGRARPWPPRRAPGPAPPGPSRAPPGPPPRWPPGAPAGAAGAPPGAGGWPPSGPASRRRAPGRGSARRRRRRPAWGRRPSGPPAPPGAPGTGPRSAPRRGARAGARLGSTAVLAWAMT